jgi:membrane fusion protein (multidrug efflux system)
VEDVDLRARVSGFLEQRLFEEGSDVEAGDLLFVIERAPYEAKVARAEAELARARATFEEAQIGLRRTEQLRARNVASQAALDAATATRNEAAAEMLAAEAALREAKLDLDYTQIHAPVAGRVGRSRFSVGDLVGPESGPLANIATLDPIWVYWQVPEAVLLGFRRQNAERVRQGLEPIEVVPTLRLADGTLYEHAGVWDFLDNRVDPTTGTQTARAVFPNPDAILLPGLYATVIVQVGAPRDTLVIPQSAVQEDQGGRFVLVVRDDDTVELRRVTMGARQGIYWEVQSGLSESERVVYQGVQKVRPGGAVAPVELRPEPPVGPAARPSAARGAAPSAPPTGDAGS